MKTLLVPKKKIGNVAGTYEINDEEQEVKTTVYIPRAYLKQLGYAKGEGPMAVEVLIPEKGQG